jgi:hypothetical protein
VERTQKVSLKTIVEDAYKFYEMACYHFKMHIFSARRLEPSSNYAVKFNKSDKILIVLT